MPAKKEREREISLGLGIVGPPDGPRGEGKVNLASPRVYDDNRAENRLWLAPMGSKFERF